MDDFSNTPLMEDSNSSNHESDPEENAHQKGQPLHGEGKEIYTRLESFLSKLGQKVSEPLESELVEVWFHSLLLKMHNFVLPYAKTKIEKYTVQNKLNTLTSKSDICFWMWILGKSLILCGKKSPSDLTHEEWKEISAMVPGTTAPICKKKWSSLIKAKQTTNKWSKEDKKLLRQIIKKLKRTPKGYDQWNLVAEEFRKKCQKSLENIVSGEDCRLKWRIMKQKETRRKPLCWRQHEDIVIMKYIFDHDCMNYTWEEISNLLRNRDPENIENRYIWLLERTERNLQKIGERRGEPTEYYLVERFLVERGLNPPFIKEQDSMSNYEWQENFVPEAFRPKKHHFPELEDPSSESEIIEGDLNSKEQRRRRKKKKLDRFYIYE